jgi:hypothetical protein
MRENKGSEKLDGNIAEGLVAGEKVCAVEVAEDPVEIFLARISIRQSGCCKFVTYHLLVPYTPSL